MALSRTVSATTSGALREFVSSAFASPSCVSLSARSSSAFRCPALFLSPAWFPAASDPDPVPVALPVAVPVPVVEPLPVPEAVAAGGVPPGVAGLEPLPPPGMSSWYSSCADCAPAVAGAAASAAETQTRSANRLSYFRHGS